MKKYSKLIILEGIDGSGKSTLAQKLCQGNGWDFIKFPTSYPKGSFQSPCQAIKFYLDDFEQGLFRIRNRSGVRSGILVCDRSYISTLVYQGVEAMKNEQPLENWRRDNPSFDEINKIGFRLFNEASDSIIYIHIDVDPRKSLERIKMRYNGKADDELDILPDEEKLSALEKLDRAYKFIRSSKDVMESLQYFSIDSSNISQSEVYDKAMQYLRGKRWQFKS
jgi:thymidylate kinase